MILFLRKRLADRTIKITVIWRTINPIGPDSAIWHKLQLHAQYSVNLREIYTTKRSWKDLHMEGIISCPPPT